MRIDQSKITRNLLGDITLPQCNFFRREAENITAMLLEISPFDYDSTSEFQKCLIVEYWRYYDGLDSRGLVSHELVSRHTVFQQWFIQDATPPENIRRAAQWLVEHGVIVLKPAVREKALTRAEEIRAGARRK